MSFLKSPRLAWSIAVAALGLWAISAPVSWGARFFDDAPADPTADTATPCLPVPAAIQTLTPAFNPTPDPNASLGTFQLCGGDQQSTARAIEQLIAGHSFSASLSSQGSGCAALTIRVSPQLSGGTASSQLSVGLGSGANLSIQIVSERGATRVNIAQS
jgi:hypothetical protein